MGNLITSIKKFRDAYEESERDDFYNDDEFLLAFSLLGEFLKNEKAQWTNRTFCDHLSDVIDNYTEKILEQKETAPVHIPDIGRNYDKGYEGD